jgi:hypothetical protein
MVFSSPLDSAMRYRADNIQVGKDLKDNSTDCDVVAEAFFKKRPWRFERFGSQQASGTYSAGVKG